ncbi:hypothetical protein JM78_09055 [Burkholderia pyrrocinia]|uniref:hypothetical protein n=1 Tax=Burkholderia pyrrocinia TaxID=60550 RepID=UPI0005072FCD|nr:hypothetical protein [Burkholderia pyrrocinia]KFL53673.1 hypothetical protein JM78_09055 [Burkholderia pyrrocinia]
MLDGGDEKPGQLRIVIIVTRCAIGPRMKSSTLKSINFADADRPLRHEINDLLESWVNFALASALDFCIEICEFAPQFRHCFLHRIRPEMNDYLLVRPHVAG